MNLENQTMKEIGNTEDTIEVWQWVDNEYVSYSPTMEIANADFKLEEGEKVHLAMATDPINEESPIYKTYYVVRESKIIIIRVD
jgi:hypothetical protein